MKTKKTIAQHNMFWTPPNTRHKTMTSKTKNTTQYILDTTKHKTQDDDKQNKNDDKQNKKHNTICFGHHQTQDTRR
jgi:hypothetical protein